MKKILIVITTLIISACDAQTDDLVSYVVQVKQSTPVNIEPYPEFNTMPAFEYKAADMRSPFVRPRSVAIQSMETKKDNCLQPNFSRQKQPLEAFGLDALSVSGTFTSRGKQWALVSANDGSLHKVTSGDYIGLFFGKITSISEGEIFITEMLPDGAGCWQENKATLSMSSQAGENDNV
ncbi:pilus assembly protein PilP [Aliiglaciecola sp. LCG003]|uniref:pilus assembly protein PilP n=1 Tax=Aliiglaciecola sp. LCG003 TaxID=3053655 RepID=UPI002572468D|nr:pilus assembly protein PilP [Aliiglaciecola sp. LCG003]WJG10014.1 pilus assembly protein PilP [Aliiglaciecola sp. LCG003]